MQLIAVIAANLRDDESPKKPLVLFNSSYEFDSVHCAFSFSGKSTLACREFTFTDSVLPEENPPRAKRLG